MRTIVLLTILFFTPNLFAHNQIHEYPYKGYKYKYTFKPPNIDCSYYYIQSESQILLDTNSEMTLVVRVLNKNKELETDVMGYVQLMFDEIDTILLALHDNNTTITIPQQSFYFNLRSMYPCQKLINKPVYINKNTNEVILTIIIGYLDFSSYHIISKKELTIDELTTICDDITYGTKKSKLKKGKDYNVMIQL